MGNILKSGLDMRKIRLFLKYKDRNVSKKSVIIAAIFNIIMLFLSLILVEHKILSLIIILLISCGILFGVINYLKNEINIRRTYIFHGIFTCFWAIVFGVYSYLLLEVELGRGAMWSAVIVFCGWLLATVLTGLYYKKTIFSDYFQYVTEASPVKTGTVALAILVARISFPENNIYISLGIVCGFAAILCAGNIYFFIKAFCYKLVEKEEEESRIPEDAIIFVEDSNCNLCKKAKQWLQDNNVEFVSRNLDEIKLRDPEIRNWHSRSDGSISRFFDSNSVIYKRMKLKDRLPNMMDEEPYELLVKNNSLLKLPILVSADYILIGFRENEWEEKLIHKK